MESKTSQTAINTCLDEMEEFKERDIAISQVTAFFFLSVTQLSKEFWLRHSSLSYYREKKNFGAFLQP